MELSVANIYAARSLQRQPISEEIQNIIAKLKISFKPAFRRPHYRQQQQQKREEPTNWRETLLSELVRKVREKDDPDYDEISGIINKLSKLNYKKLIEQVIEKLGKRDEMFRLRVTTLLFDRGVNQSFFATIMADTYVDIVKNYPEATGDLLSQINMFNELYDVKNVKLLPAGSGDFDDALCEFMKQKQKKLGFAIYVSELYARNLITHDLMIKFVNTVVDDIKDSVGNPKTNEKEEHVDALVKFLIAVAPKVLEVKQHVKQILAIPKEETPCLNMKSRFKLMDCVEKS